MFKKLIILLIIITPIAAFGQLKTGINGAVDWDINQINARVSLDLISAGVRLPAGRSQGESLLRESYVNLIRPGILSIQVDSSSTIGDLVERGDFTLAEIETLALGASSVAPALSPDMRSISASHTISLLNISSALMRHNRPAPVTRTLNPVSSAQYTGIIIIAAENLPVHGMRSTALPIPCLFPKIWDSEMNLIYERNTVDPRNSAMVKYSAMQSIFQSNHPSGLSPELQEVVGQRPLRIFARGVFGISPTDLIIDRNDALLIISSEENRSLLSQGRVAFILDSSVLRYEFNGE
ncbi:MAG: polymerase [Treponema sp.]|nr:polymerase [Treponema sp.]